LKKEGGRRGVGQDNGREDKGQEEAEEGRGGGLEGQEGREVSCEETSSSNLQANLCSGLNMLT